MGRNEHESSTVMPPTTSVVTSTPLNSTEPPQQVSQPNLQPPLPDSHHPNQNSTEAIDVLAALPSVPTSAPLSQTFASSPQPADTLRRVEQNEICENSLPSLSRVDVDATHLLKRVSVPKFSGNKKSYEAWKAVFYSCVDKSKASAEFKLLHLRDCLEGEALKVVLSRTWDILPQHMKLQKSV